MKPVGGGVYEYRIDFGPGYRVYFGRQGSDIVVVLAGGSKQRQARDIAAAIALWAAHKSSSKEK
jgi:putative addiction module killer protein